MMPVATPPNAIVFAGGRVRGIDMVRVGIVLNLAGIVVVTVTGIFLLIATAVLGIDPAAMPE